jgi:hypothetical protein
MGFLGCYGVENFYFYSIEYRVWLVLRTVKPYINYIRASPLPRAPVPLDNDRPPVWLD